MTLQNKIYIGFGIAAILILGILGGNAWSNHKIANLESIVETAKREADNIQQTANKKELEAAEYKMKIEYLTRQISEIQLIARKQDEELEKFNRNSARARGDAMGARRIRSIAATATELCAKLAEIGHGCE